LSRLNPNQAPVAVAGNDLEAEDSDYNGSEIIALNGSASFDADAVSLSYEWKEGETSLGIAQS